MDDLTKKKSLDDDLRNRLHAAIKEYAANFKAELADGGKGVKTGIRVQGSGVSKMVQSFRDLTVWQRSIEVAVVVYRLTQEISAR